MASLQDSAGYNQGFKVTPTHIIRLQRRGRRILEYLPRESKNIVELGCGTGELATFLSMKSDHCITAVDSNCDFIEMARRNHADSKIQFETLTVDAWSLNRIERVEAWIGNGILHHLIGSLPEILRRMYDKLPANGRLVFWEPNLLNPYVFLIFKFEVFRKLAKLDPSEMAFTKSFIERELLIAGFKNISVQYRDFLLPNIPQALVPFICWIGEVLEKTPLRCLSQSLFIYAEK